MSVTDGIRQTPCSLEHYLCDNKAPILNAVWRVEWSLNH